MVAEEDEACIRASHASFMARWGLDTPLHSYELRNRTGKFAWVGALGAAERSRFYIDLSRLLTSMPVRVTACVIDRRGYDARYRERYGKRRWAMSRTAFSIVVERTAKVASSDGRKLKVWFEQHSKAEDREVLSYFSDMRSNGMPFDPYTSKHYQPLDVAGLSSALSSCHSKRKTSPMVQLADLVLFPVCIGRYDPQNRAYRTLIEAGLLIDQHLGADLIATQGIKYSCFDEG